MLSKKRITILTIILFNLAPIIGVAFYDWSPFEMFWLFWMETLIISFFNAVKVFFSQQHNPGGRFIQQPVRLNAKASFKYLLLRLFIFFFYALFIIVFIGFLAHEEKNPVQVVKTLAFQNTLFNLALALIFSFHAIYLMKYFFLNGAYLYSKTSDFSGIFDGRQIVMHIAVVLGAVGAMFLFKGAGNARFASVWVIAILSIVKCVFELLFSANSQEEVVYPAGQV